MQAANERAGISTGSLVKGAAGAHPLKLTALTYIKEALREERYEEMAEMVAIAREFGAGVWDIRAALSKESY